MNPFDWLFRNRETGEITMGQPPNPAIKVVVVSGIVHWLFPDDAIGRLARVVSIGALVFWALDELVRGVNPYRRATGLGTLAAQVARLLR